MDKSKKTPSKKSKPAEDLSPPFLIDLQKTCEENDFKKLIQCFVLNSEVSAGIPWTTYPHSVKISPEEERLNIYIAYDNFERQGIISKLYIKNETVPIIFLESLFLLFPKYDTFTSIKLEYCNLIPSEIEFLQTIFTEFQNITELSLNGNPNNRQNFSILLEGTNIKHLSLKRCKINEYGMKKICKNLWHSAPNKLLTLNLAGNYIDDNAVTHLAKMLRQNRKLRTINLADNWITDTGCCVIMSSLQNFALTQEEIIIKRKINLTYYKQKAILIEEYRNEQEQINESKIQLGVGSQKALEKVNASKTKREIQDESLARINSSRKTSKKHSKLVSKEFISESPSCEDRQLSFYTENNLPKRTHPFTLDIAEKDGEISCFGNMKLSYINLACNKISCTGYKCIIQTLNYQLSNDNLGPGLIYISIDGNADLNSPEFNEIYKILMEKKLKMTTNSASKTTILNKRSSSKYSSAFYFL